MTVPGINTAQFNGWLARMRAGDAAARDELPRACGRRLEHLARKMLRGFPGVKVHDCCPLSGGDPAKRGRGDPS